MRAKFSRKCGSRGVDVTAYTERPKQFVLCSYEVGGAGYACALGAKDARRLAEFILRHLAATPTEKP